MRRLLFILLALFAFLLPLSAIAHDGETQGNEGSSRLASLPWKQGPMTAPIGSNASMKVPEGYMYLDPAGARQFNAMTENPSPDHDEYVVAKKDMSWVAFFNFDPIGYVKDDEKLDAGDLLKQLEDGTEQSNDERRKQGWKPLEVTGWAFPPQYDNGIRSLEWAFKLKEIGDTSETVNYNTRLLGRRGVMEVLLLTSPEDLNTAVADFKAKLPGFSYSSGESYAEYKSGDHVAEYGLAALVTGGAVAVAAKKGLFASLGLLLVKLWKVVLIGIAAVGAGIKKFLGGGERKNGPTVS